MARKKQLPTHSSGMYCYRIRCRRPDGTQYQKPFYSSKSKEDARKKAEAWKLNQEIVKKTGIIPSDLRGEPFDRWAKKWLASYKKGTVKEHTYKFTYQSVVEKYLVPYFGSTPLPDIMQVDIQRYIKEVRQPDGKPLAKSSLEKHIVTLQGIFERAEANHLIPKNPVKDIALPSDAPKAPERDYWMQEEVNVAKEWLLRYTPRRTTHKGLNGTEGIRIMLETGVRRSELLGLKWDDIRWDQCGIHVQRAVVPTTGEIVIGGTKTEKSDRFVPVSEEFLGWLKALPHYGQYIIPGQDPELPRSPNGWASAFKEIMRLLCQDTGLPPLTPHELRHTYGTVLRENGTDIYTISRVMGHSSVTVTEKIYVHNNIKVLRKRMKLGQIKSVQVSTG